jgi:hypothetical protein
LHLAGHFRLLYHDARKYEYQVYSDGCAGKLLRETYVILHTVCQQRDIRGSLTSEGKRIFLYDRKLHLFGQEIKFTSSCDDCEFFIASPVLINSDILHMKLMSNENLLKNSFKFSDHLKSVSVNGNVHQI